MKLRCAKESDIDAIHQLITELAIYEREPNAVINTPEQLIKDLFIDEVCHSFVVENDKAEIVAFALYYFGYSTWKGRTIYLEDLYVQPNYRKAGLGDLLFDAVVQEGKMKGVKRMDWQVLEWNEPAIQFYKKKKAILDGEWVNGRLFF
jgi:GNAT superfamily N-acetyltransferase